MLGLAGACAADGHIMPEKNVAGIRAGRSSAPPSPEPLEPLHSAKPYIHEPSVGSRARVRRKMLSL